MNEGRTTLQGTPDDPNGTAPAVPPVAGLSPVAEPSAGSVNGAGHVAVTSGLPISSVADKTATRVLLVIDDDRTILHLIERAFEHDAEIRVMTARSADEGLTLIKEHHIDVLLLDIIMPGISGLDLLGQIRQWNSQLPVILITADETSETAIQAMKLGGFEYLVKPLDVNRVRSLVHEAVAISLASRAPFKFVEAEGVPDGDVLVGRSPQMQEVYKAIGRVAPQDITVLVRGESGTGKELIARAIVQHSKRAFGPFMAVNCAAIPEPLLESELFGHEKGAFTGAAFRRLGKFEQCSGGTLFLDEVGDMSPLVQSKVLRLLQDQTFERVGGTKTIKTDVRIIAATNRDLEKMVAEGQFRNDLYYRLNVFRIHLAPLRERQGDILLLLQHFLARFNRQLGKEVTGISPEALDLLLEYSWPGNIRELQSALKEALLNATGPVLVASCLPDSIHAKEKPEAAPAGEAAPRVGDLQSFVEERLNAGTEELYDEALKHMERYVVTRVLNMTDGNQSKAAKILGVTRVCLRNKIRTLGLSIERTINVRRDGAGHAANHAASEEEDEE